MEACRAARSSGGNTPDRSCGYVFGTAWQRVGSARATGPTASWSCWRGYILRARRSSLRRSLPACLTGEADMPNLYINRENGNSSFSANKLESYVKIAPGNAGLLACRTFTSSRQTEAVCHGIRPSTLTEGKVVCAGCKGRRLSKARKAQCQARHGRIDRPRLASTEAIPIAQCSHS